MGELRGVGGGEGNVVETSEQVIMVALATLNYRPGRLKGLGQGGRGGETELGWPLETPSKLSPLS